MSDDLPLYDHRRLGRILDLFHVQDEAAGSVFWHSRGHALYLAVERYIRDRLRGDGYREVKTPQLVDRSLWERSGHWDKFRRNMFTIAEDPAPEASDVWEAIATDKPTHQLAVKPMNCPCHVQIFNARTVSYRDLPVRMAEFGCCHRNEPSGSLHGIMRVRQFTQDDAHIFCTEDQVLGETKRFCDLLMSVYKDFGFTDVEVSLSTRPEVRAGDDATWDRAEMALADAVSEAGLAYVVQPGEGAFYGPKLEFALRDLRGRRWQCGTLQLDHVLPERLDAAYVGPDGAKHRPVMLHRAILGSLERFIGILIEHYEGRLPAWLCPVQAVVVTVRPEQADYAWLVHGLLESGPGLRVEIDDRDENLAQKIKEHSERGVPFILVVGPRDEAATAVAVRRLGSTRNEVMPLADAQELVAEACARPTVGGFHY